MELPAVQTSLPNTSISVLGESKKYVLLIFFIQLDRIARRVYEMCTVHPINVNVKEFEPERRYD